MGYRRLGGAARMLMSARTGRPAADDKAPADKPAAAGKVEFKMEQVSLLKETENQAALNLLFSSMHSVALSDKPAAEVKAYPKLKSKRPLYGTLVLDVTPGKPGSGTKYYFVLDESAPPAKPAEKPAAKPEKKTEKQSEKKADKPDATPGGKSTKEPPADYRVTLEGTLDLTLTDDDGELAVQPGGKTAKKPAGPVDDRLYFDANHDLDLTNDADPIWPRKSWPSCSAASARRSIFTCSIPSA